MTPVKFIVYFVLGIVCLAIGMEIYDFWKQAFVTDVWPSVWWAVLHAVVAGLLYHVYQMVYYSDL